LGLLRLWKHYETQRAELSRNQLQRRLRREFLSPNRMREWSDVYRQLRDMAASGLGKKRKQRVRLDAIRYASVLDTPATETDRPIGRQKRLPRSKSSRNSYPIVAPEIGERIHRALLAGLLPGVAMLKEPPEYLGAGGLKLHLWPGSGVFAKKPKWIVSAELVETSRQYARTIGRVTPECVESVAEHRLKDSYSDAHWSKRLGGAFCYQQRSLNGLPVVSRRRKPLAPVDPTGARQLLIQHGLAEEQLTTKARFVQHNRKLQQAIGSLAAKTRRRDLVVDDYKIQWFYQQRLPGSVCDRTSLELLDKSIAPPNWISRLGDDSSVAAWFQQPERIASDDDSLYMRPEDLLDVEDVDVSATSYPDSLAVGETRLPLSYCFRPGEQDDGIQLTIHQDALPQVSDDRLDWLVSGAMLDKITAMIKSLPKRLRRNLVPAAESAAKAASHLQEVEGTAPFMPSLCRVLSQLAETQIQASDFNVEKLPPHMHFWVRVVDDAGNEIDRDRGVDQIKRRFSVGGGDATHSADAGPDEAVWQRRVLTSFELERIPSQLVVRRGGVQIEQFPGLRLADGKVETHLFADRKDADRQTDQAIARLLTHDCRKSLRNQVRHLPGLEDAKLKLSGIAGMSGWEDPLMQLLSRVALVDRKPSIRDRATYDARVAEAPGEIAAAVPELSNWLSRLTEAYHEMRVQWEDIRRGKMEAAKADLSRQRDWMLADEFLTWTPWEHLQHFPRYLRGMAYRMERVRSNASKDAENQAIVEGLWERWTEQNSLPEGRNPGLEPRQAAQDDFRWMIEELRISLFAQPLGTAVKVSPQRCEKLIAK
ncbi:MAG: DUF3418 domain-containing protein, partial [Planctomycetota bacterium]